MLAILPPNSHQILTFGPLVILPSLHLILINFRRRNLLGWMNKMLVLLVMWKGTKRFPRRSWSVRPNFTILSAFAPVFRFHFSIMSSPSIKLFLRSKHPPFSISRTCLWESLTPRVHLRWNFIFSRRLTSTLSNVAPALSSLFLILLFNNFV